MSPFRTQALVIKNVVQEERKDELPKAILNSIVIGSFEDFLSCTFDTVIVSFCKTEVDNVMQKPLLSSLNVIEFLKTRVAVDVQDTKLVIVAKAECLPEHW